MQNFFTPHGHRNSLRCFFLFLLFSSSEGFAFSGLSWDLGYSHSLQKMNDNYVTEKRLGIEWAPSGWISATRSLHPILRISTGQWSIADGNVNAIGASVGGCHFTPSFQRFCLLSHLSSAKNKSVNMNIFKIEAQFIRFIGPDFLSGIETSYFQTKFNTTQGFLVGIVLGHKL